MPSSPCNTTRNFLLSLVKFQNSLSPLRGKLSLICASNSYFLSNLKEKEWLKAIIEKVIEKMHSVNIKVKVQILSERQQTCFQRPIPETKYDRTKKKF